MAAHAEPRYVIDELGRKVAVILPIEVYEGLVDPRTRRDERRAFQFSDLVGKLRWTGDALEQQLQLRDEW